MPKQKIPVRMLFAPLVIILLVAGLIPIIRIAYAPDTETLGPAPDLIFLDEKPHLAHSHSAPEHGFWELIDVTGSQSEIGELHLHDDGFSVTYDPFESYKDYWGTYSLDKNTNKVVFEIVTQNRIPEPFIGSGSLRLIDENNLELVGVIGNMGGSETRMFQRETPATDWQKVYKQRDQMKLSR